MEQNKRPIFSLSVEEYVELHKSLQQEYKYLHLEPEKVEESKPDIIYSDEAAELTNYTKSTLYTKVSRGELPRISSRRPLTFSRAQLTKWMLKGRPTVADMIAEEFMNSKKAKR
ncbi:DNA-binding protein [Brumimicrobium glaciale]|uniref:DNA-binding protein n=1 Tax=Brumimicrobium glaciale TaxID=200475 RepID=A0A4Q4KN15_9FLAO|nr:helix-turn-helix domain-containing protein [Brumimicrobium glaciale]RYM34823.1 DNA-binding protein [Brumimicrobium glaciale]